MVDEEVNILHSVEELYYLLTSQ